MNLNPEFQRNLWLEVTLHRLIGMPLVLGGIFFLVSLAGNEGNMAKTAMGLFCLFAFGWGTYLTGETVTSEVKHRTWDLQRMSSISPWAMTWGKLFGSTIYPWYGALISLMVCIMAGGDYQPVSYVVLLLSAVISQSAALLASLLAIGKGQSLDRSAAVGHMVVGLIAASPFLSLLYSQHPVTWWGHTFTSPHFALLSVVLWGCWAIIGCYRTMSTELQVARVPGAWVAFVLMVWLYVTGFVQVDAANGKFWHASLFIGYVLTGLLTYLALYNDPKDPAMFRRMLVARAHGQWRRFFEEMPTWLPTLALAAIFGFVLSVLLLTTDQPAPVDERKLADTLYGMQGVIWLMALYLFVLRDVAIMWFFNLGKRRVRADWTAILYLGVLYGLVPSILMAMGWKDAAMAFWPWWPEHPWLSLASGALQAGLAGALVLRRWRSGFGARPLAAVAPGEPA
jgi:hypothetical protein